MILTPQSVLSLCVVPSSVAGWYTNLFLVPLLGWVVLLRPGSTAGVALGLCCVNKIETRDHDANLTFATNQ